MLNLQVTNTGTIYVYENAKGEFKLIAVTQRPQSDEVRAKNPATLGRQRPMSSGSRYGNALISLGKLKDDGFEAFAVGAPFEDEGRGAVYIYFGSKTFWRNDGSSKGTTT